MLYPREEQLSEDRKVLVYTCRLCGYNEKAPPMSQEDNCIYSSSNEAEKEKFAIDKEIIQDPTLPRRENTPCPAGCPKKQAVTFCNLTKSGMDLYFVCTECTKSWIKDSIDPNHDIPMSKRELAEEFFE